MTHNVRLLTSYTPRCTVRTLKPQNHKALPTKGELSILSFTWPSFCFITYMAIDHKIILANAPSNIGQQVNVNHIGCEAGEDKKKRLYIKRIEKGLMAYCHHCNQKGFAKDGDTRLGSWVTGKPTTVVKTQQKPILGPLSLGGKIWLHQNNCTSTSKLFSGILDDPKKVAMTLQNVEGATIGWQIRNLVPDAVPKYTTYFINAKDKSESAWFCSNAKTLVITEDYLSAYRVSRDVGFSSMALLRTTITDKTLLQIYDMGFKEIYIWLDSDEAGVKGAAKVSKTLRHFLPSDVKLMTIHSNEEPKHLTPEELVRKFL
jgi:hypothetical protein